MISILGKGTGVSPEYKFLGLGGLVVMRLGEHLPENENFKIFFDNFFTGMPLLLELKSKGMYSLGVLKPNRMSGAVLKTQKSLEKEGRGSMDSRISKSGEVAVVRWNDNKCETSHQHLWM